jgi:hypothetical protein
MKSELFLEITDNYNPKILKITDVSSYNEDLPVTCGILEITLPFCNTPISFNVAKDFIEVYNSNLLRLTKVKDYNCLGNLPDGAYTIKYSINPNDKLFTNITFFKNAIQMNKYKDLICKLELNYLDDRLNSDEMDELREKFSELKDIIDTARIKAENCCNVEDAYKLYNYANILIGKYQHKCEC